MSDAPLILGVSGLRGIVGESLTPEVAVRYAGAFSQWLRDAGYENPTVVVGRDGRAGGEVIEQAAIDGLVQAGCDVVRLGMATTPSVGVAVSSPEIAAGLVITASHNPAEWNGLKCIVFDRGGIGGRARAPLAIEAEQIIDLFQSDRADFCDSGTTGVVTAYASEVQVHVDCVDDYVFMNLSADELKRVGEFNVVLDSVNCSGSTIAVPLLSKRANFHAIACDGSGRFPHTPEPTKENLSGEGGLCDAVPGLKADVGFAQDPDADRLAIVDELGNYIGEEYTLVLCAAAFMEGRKASRQDVGSTKNGKPVFVVNLSTSRMIDDVAAHYGAEVVRTAVGEANVVERMKALTADGRDVVMGGEGNGGVIWAEVTYVRDSLSAMALTLSLMARTGKTVSELVKMVDAMGPGKAGYSIIKKKAALASKADAVPVVEHLTKVFGEDSEARVDTQDGVRVDWDAKGVWAHVRASNTEPIMRVIVEAPTGAMAEETAAMVEARIAEVRS